MTAASAARGGFSKATPISVATTTVTPDVKLRMAFVSMMFPLSTTSTYDALPIRALASRTGSFDLETVADLTKLKAELGLVQGRHSPATGGMLKHDHCSSRTPKLTSTNASNAE